MSHLLWKYYLEDNVDKFESLLSSGGQNTHHVSKAQGGGANLVGTSIGSPGIDTSPRTSMKMRKTSGLLNSSSRLQGNYLTRTDVNARDQVGLTILHRAASSSGKNSLRFATALIQHPAIDIYLQDQESGWTALHRALYFGNVTIAWMLLEKDLKDATGQGLPNIVTRTRATPLIKLKDHEGNSAFDVYNATIARRDLGHRRSSESSTEDGLDDTTEDDTSSNPPDSKHHPSSIASIDGNELFAFGSNKNITLGFGDSDDRSHPERIILKRPDHLLFRFYREYMDSNPTESTMAGEPAVDQPSSVGELPTLVKNRPLVIQDVILSKLHSAVLTTDPESNLYVCGFGPGGRLGTGDEVTRFSYVCIEAGVLAGKKIETIALGQNHSLCVSAEGEVFSWGTNDWGQLGYSLPRPLLPDEEPVNSLPRQIFGPLKREVVIGVAASAIHSVAHTSTSLYTWGKNMGQLGLMDSDSRSLGTQIIPRKVAASLFTSPIEMISAIDTATICLLANHSVCVFTNYGYNYVKFPMQDTFHNYHLSRTSFTTRYEGESYISSITSGGDSIAAISSRGDLFTVNVSQKPGPAAASTTNPAKIRNALSQPQRIWSLRKGHWDGIKSVGVGENGSVIICTQAGAVWRRVKHAKVKDAFTSNTENFKKKGYKFERVPGLTNVVAVRCNMFGSHAAVRKDCDVTKSHVVVEPGKLWKEISPLFCLQDFIPKDTSPGNGENPRFWTPGLPLEKSELFRRTVIASPELEEEIFKHMHSVDDGKYDAEVFSSLSNTGIPVNAFILAARSSTIRDALIEFRLHGEVIIPDLLKIDSNGPRIRVEFQGLDFITILNLVLYVYKDSIVDVWHFTRHVPDRAFRFRQIRTELMKVAAKLGMSKLESATRLMSEPERQLGSDFASAIQIPSYFEDGDAIIELDGDERCLHSVLLCQRCPFFEALFNGRASGQWLDRRREECSGAVRIDMKHIDPVTFDLVIRHLYADVGVELFDQVVSADLDDFYELVMDVMETANELMLDRLSQICQHVIGRFVNTRNICQLLNAVSPCSVTEFKDAGLEYLCLQLESILENHLLNDIDEQLLLELNDVVRANQLNCLPYAKSGMAELLLLEKHPGLAGEIDEDRQRWVRDLAFRRTQIRQDENRPSSHKGRIGALEDIVSASPGDKERRKSKSRNAPFSPNLEPKDSSADLMFDMDDEGPLRIGAAHSAQAVAGTMLDPRHGTAFATSPRPIKDTAEEACKILDDSSPMLDSVQFSTTPISPLSRRGTPSHREYTTLKMGNVPWSSAALPSSRLDMKDIMAQASNGRTSALSMSLSVQKAKDDSVAKSTIPKVSQKERRRQQQQSPIQLQLNIERALPSRVSSSPWKVTASGAKTSLRDVLDIETGSSPSSQQTNTCSSSIPQLSFNKRRTASPDTRFSGQPRISSYNNIRSSIRGTVTASSSSPVTDATALSSTPHSKSFTNAATKSEPSLQLSMADIIGQQRLEQDIIKEAVAKRSLQEIQEEQAFQEWWDQESRRAQEEELDRIKAATVRTTFESTRGKRSKKARGGGSARGQGGGDASTRNGSSKGRDLISASNSGSGKVA